MDKPLDSTIKTRAIVSLSLALPIRDYAHHTFRHLSLHRCIPGKSVTLSRMASGLDFSDWQLSAVLSVGNGAGSTLVPSITGLAQQRCTTISHCVSLTSAIFLRRIRSLANSENLERNHSDVHRFVGCVYLETESPDHDSDRGRHSLCHVFLFTCTSRDYSQKVPNSTRCLGFDTACDPITSESTLIS